MNGTLMVNAIRALHSHSRVGFKRKFNEAFARHLSAIRKAGHYIWFFKLRILP